MSFMPHYDDRFRFPSSRDWESYIVCNAKDCICNTGCNECFSPSLCKIGENGICINYKKEIN